MTVPGLGGEILKGGKAAGGRSGKLWQIPQTKML